MVHMTDIAAKGITDSNSGIVLSEQIHFQRTFECSLVVSVANMRCKRVPLLSSTNNKYKHLFLSHFLSQMHSTTQSFLETNIRLLDSVFFQKVKTLIGLRPNIVI